MLTDPINRTLEIDSRDAAAPGCSHEEQTRRCDATVGKACAVLGLGTLEAPWVPMELWKRVMEQGWLWGESRGSDQFSSSRLSCPWVLHL